MTDFTPEQIEKIRKAHSNASNWDIDDLIAELTKPEWKPAVGQYYLNDTGGAYKSDHEHRVFGANIRHFTTKEAGPECMQHLVDAIERIGAECGCGSVWYTQELNKALAKHRELIDQSRS